MTASHPNASSLWRKAGLALVFAWFTLGGIGHFVLTNTFAAVVPPYIPFARLVVLATGACELIGAAALLSSKLRPLAGLALMAFCVCVTPVHIDMLIHADQHRALGAPLLWARLLFQPVFIWIIWRTTRAPR